MPLSRQTQSLLQTMPLFARMEAPAATNLTNHLTETRLTRGAFLFHEGDPGSKLFIVCAGLLKVTKYGTSSRGIAIRLVPPGAMCGEVAVLDGLPYPASAEALEDTLLVGLTQKNLVNFLEQNPRAALAVMAVMAARLRAAYSELRALASDTIERRVSMMLLKFVATLPEDRLDTPLSIPLSRQDLAELVGGAKENVSRAMARLKRLRIIKGARGKIVIASPAKLKAICGAS